MHISKLSVDVRKDTDGTYLATNDDVYTHGIGATPLDAVADFMEALEELYNQHLDGETLLAPHLQRELDYLRTVFSE